MDYEVPVTWATRELPILRLAVRAAEERSEIELGSLAAELGLEPRQARIAVEELREAGYLKAHGAGGMKVYVTGVTEKGRVATGSWPSSEGLLDELIDALEHAAESEPEPERKQALHSAARMLGGVVRETAAAELRLSLHKLGLPLP